MFGKITSSRSKIRASVAQHVDQLQRHAVTLAESKHLVLGAACEIANMPETESRPKFTDTTGHQVRVSIEIGSGAERANFLRITKALKIEHLATSNFFEHDANVVAVCVLRCFQTSKIIR